MVDLKIQAEITPPKNNTLIKKSGNPALVKGYVLNPAGRPKGSMNKWSNECLEILGLRSKSIINKVIEKALNNEDKDQALMLKLCIERIIPQQKAIEVIDPNGKELSVRIIVDSVEKFNSTTIMDGEIVDDWING